MGRLRASSRSCYILSMHDLDALLQALTALAIGLLIGLERERSQSREGSRTAGRIGIRTCALAALSGNLMTWFPGPWQPWTILAGMGFTVALAILSYLRTSLGRHADTGITSEFALFICYILGVMTGSGQSAEAGIIGIILLALLHFKAMLHKFSRTLSQQDMQMAIQFLVISMIVLPLLPNQGYGPFHALNPHRIWLMVVLISGLGFAAYAGIKLLGDKAGLSLTGLLGGIVSSTAVTMAMARISRTAPSLGHACVLATLWACGSVFIRVWLLSLILFPDVANHLVTSMLAIVSFVALLTLMLWRRPQQETNHADAGYAPDRNPLSFRTALMFGFLYGLVLMFSHWAYATLGTTGILGVAAASGLTDVDAITLTLNEMARKELESSLAAKAILIACVSNTLVKWSLAMGLGARNIRLPLSIGLLPMAAFGLMGALLI